MIDYGGGGGCLSWVVWVVKSVVCLVVILVFSFVWRGGSKKNRNQVKEIPFTRNGRERGKAVYFFVVVSFFWG